MTATPTVESLLAQWVEAFNSHDLDRHMELYTEDAILFGSVDELQDGRDAVRSYFGRRGPGVQVKSYPMPQVRKVTADVACHRRSCQFRRWQRAQSVSHDLGPC